jgi:hypothetical protein
MTVGGGKKNKNHFQRGLLLSGEKAFLCTPFQHDGFLAERLGTALQKLLQRFESAGNL